MGDYKNEVDKVSLADSDKKKLLALPYSMSLRTQLPEPKRGMDEWDLFEDWCGEPWDKYDNVLFDEEKKVTEFDYEKFLPKVVIDQFGNDQDALKKHIRKINILTLTKQELHNRNKEEFKEYMPLLAGLSRHEKESLLHAISNRKFDDLEYVMSNQEEKILSKVQEKEAFALKNRYRHDKQTMSYADKTRQPISKSKLRDVLLNKEEFHNKITEEVVTYDYETRQADKLKENSKIAVLAEMGAEMKSELNDLMKDIGVKAGRIEYYGEPFLAKKHAAAQAPNVQKFAAIQNQIFQSLDLTDYDTLFIEHKKVPSRYERLPFMQHLTGNDLIEEVPGAEYHDIEDTDVENQQVRTFEHLEYLEAKALEAIAEENAEDEFEGDELGAGDEDDEDEEGDEEGGEEDYGDEDYGEEEGEVDPLDTESSPM